MTPILVPSFVQFPERYSTDKYVLRLEITRFTACAVCTISVKFRQLGRNEFE